MSKILEFIAEETGGKPYKSHRFCYDAEVKLPSLSYDDAREFTVCKDRSGETDTRLTTPKNLTEAAQVFGREQPLFRYFFGRFAPGLQINSHFLIGPEGAHLNISGISGLASKTSKNSLVSRRLPKKIFKVCPT